MNMPAVIRLFEFVKPNKDVKFYQAFTRRNIFLRDGGRCAYCGAEVSLNKFTRDHIVPKSRGGRLGWTNIVVSCQKCNAKKGNRLPQEAGMKLIHKPFAPVIADDFHSGIMSRISHIAKMMDNKYWLTYCH